jgi:hypothetical protein
MIRKAAPLGSLRRRPHDVAAADENKGGHPTGATGAEITHAFSVEIDDVLWDSETIRQQMARRLSHECPDDQWSSVGSSLVIATVFRSTVAALATLKRAMCSSG